MAYPLVSIIVTAYNEINNINHCLDSLLNQTYPNYELIVYDNNSNDGTPEFIQEKFPAIRLIRGECNLGFGGGNNYGAQKAKGEYLGFINADAVVEPNWLIPIIDYFLQDSSIGAIGAELVSSEDHTIVLSHGTNIHFSGIAYARDKGKKVINSTPFETPGISGGAFVIPKQLFFDLGGFESIFFLYYEDTDLSLRIQAFGKRCFIVPQSKVYHQPNLLFNTNKIYYLERNRYLSLFSIINKKYLIFMLPALIITEGMSWGYCILRGSAAILAKQKAWSYIIKNWNWITDRRKLMNNYSEINFLDIFTPRMEIDYVGNGYLSSVIAKILGWISAAPFLILAKWLSL